MINIFDLNGQGWNADVKRNQTTILCNRIAVQDVSTGKVAAHQLAVHEKLQDNEIHNSLLRMYQTEFVENVIG